MAAHSIVAPPELTPLPGGLFSILTFRNEGRWEQGVMWPSLPCGSVNTASAVVCDPDVSPDPENEEGAEDTGLPDGWPLDSGAGRGRPWTETEDVFWVYGSFKCSPVGTTFEQMDQRALSNLFTNEESAVERRFWAKLLEESRGNDFTPEDPIGTRQGIGILEQMIWSRYGGGGSIHIPRALASRAGLKLSGQRLITSIGTPVVAGDYGEPTPGQGYQIIAVPPIVAYRSDAEILGDPEQSFDRGRNDVTSTAHRAYLIGHEQCPVFTLKIDPNL